MYASQQVLSASKQYNLLTISTGSPPILHRKVLVTIIHGITGIL